MEEQLPYVEFEFPPQLREDGFEDLVLEFWQDDDETIPWDFTGYEAVMQLKNANKVVFTFKTGASQTATTAPIIISGNEVRLVGFNELNIPAYNYAYGLKFKDSTGFKLTPIQGTIPVYQNVTENDGFD